MKTLIFVLAIISLGQYSPATTYVVGPGEAYENIGDVPWESLQAGDSVLIHWREQPYAEKFVICARGRQDAPIVVRGVTAPNNGPKPVITGENATTRTKLNFWNESRGIIKVGGANVPADLTPAYIRIENLEIHTGRPGYYFTGRAGRMEYDANCSAIYFEKGENCIVRSCILHDCGNGFFAASGTHNLLFEKNYIYDNGIEGSIYEHNNYTEAFGITFQFNRFGKLRAGCGGNNLKDRSTGCVIRYNWLDGGNRQLDLVDSDYPEFYNDSSYRKTYVYGNILVEYPGDGNNQIIHYGGDSGDNIRYRKGTLFLYNNTIISYRTDNTTLIRLSSSEETCEAFNNLIYTLGAAGRLALLADLGTINLNKNFLQPGWVQSHSSNNGTVNDFGNILGKEPGFWDFTAQWFYYQPNTICSQKGIDIRKFVDPLYRPDRFFFRILDFPGFRWDEWGLDIGAYPAIEGLGVNPWASPASIAIYPNPFNEIVTLTVPDGAKLSVCDLSGRIFDTVSLPRRGEERSTYGWRPKLPQVSGMYFFIIESGTRRSVVPAVRVVR